MSKTPLYEQSAVFKAYDAKNPEIWPTFKDLTLILINKGIEHYGAKAIFEAIRFHKAMKHGVNDFKLNNNFTAEYAREFMRLYPEHAGFFEVRQPPKKQKQPAAADPAVKVSSVSQAGRILGQAAHKKIKQPSSQKRFAWGK